MLPEIRQFLQFFTARTHPPEARTDIDGLRALAVIGVILFHLHIAPVSGGYVGVDVFFVISGYLITQMIRSEMQRGHFQVLPFFERRIRRIVPGLFDVLLVASIGATLLLSPADLVKFAESMMAALLFATNIYFYQHSGYFSDADDKPLLHLWSLGVEGQFYMLWPLLLVLIMRYLRPTRHGIAFAVLGMLSLGLAVGVARHDAEAGFYLMPSRLFEFLIGASLPLLPAIAASQRRLATAAFALGVGIVLAAMLLYTKHTPFPSFYALAPCIGAALIIHSGALARGRWLLANPAMSYLGRISYELYLFHWPLIVLFTYRTLDGVSAMDKAVLMLATLAFSAASYHGIHKPLRYCLRKTLAARQNLLIMLQVVWLGLIGVVLSMSHSGGWTWRLSETGQMLVHNPGKFHQTQFGGAGINGDQFILLGDRNAPPQFLLFGDSFAAQYGLALNDYLQAHHKSAYLYTVSGCLITPNLTGFVPQQSSPVCDAAFAKVQNFLASSNLPVIHAQSWNTYQNKLYQRDGTLLSYANKSVHDYNQALFNAIGQTHQALGGRRYLVVGLAPGIPDQKGLTRCFQVPNYLPSDCDKHAAVPESDRTEGMQFNLEIQQYVAAHPDITFLNPREVLCRNGLCYAIRDGRIFYSDFVHLSKAGAMEVVDHYHEIFDSLHP